MHKIPLIFAAFVTACSPVPDGGHAVTAPDGTEWQPLKVERLPDLNAPRGNHRTFVFGDEVVLIGGHTDGFKPIETAEYFSGGAWHTVPMLYPHMNGFAARLQDGRILIGGGSGEAFGIGHSWGTEIYDPASHSFTSPGIMTAKRAMPSALALADGRVLIAGNWHTEDSFETWSPESGFVPGEALDPGWAEPFILPASPDDVIIFGEWDTFGNRPGGRIDHIGGQTEFDPFLDNCYPGANYSALPEEFQIADYTYLLPIRYGAERSPVILKVDRGRFSLLETDRPLPEAGPDGNPVYWQHIQVDRPSRIAWAEGFVPQTGTICLARVAYDATFDGNPASVTLYYAGRAGGFPLNCAKLLPGGRFILAGGTGWKTDSPTLVGNFFTTFTAAYMFHTEQGRDAGVAGWIPMIAILAVTGCAILAAVMWKRRRMRMVPVATDAPDGLPRQNLLDQISALVEEKELYRRKDLRITDLAAELATNKTYVSMLLNNISGESFTTMIARCRVQYAQKLMKDNPEMMLDDVADQSGFSSYVTFYRNFKAVTGMTPQEWKKH